MGLSFCCTNIFVHDKIMFSGTIKNPKYLIINYIFQSVQYIPLGRHFKLQAAMPLFVNQYFAQYTHTQNNTIVSKCQKTVDKSNKQHFIKRGDILYILINSY